MTHPIFNDCAAKDSGRYSINRSWVRGGWRCSTDGSICVRQRTDEPDTVPEDGEKFPPFEELPWPKGGDVGVPLTLPDIPDEDIIEECQKCGGMGLCVCSDCDHEHDCAHCEGEGSITRAVRMYVGGRAFQAKYLRVLRRHGCALYHNPGPSHVPAYFTGPDGIEGLLMQMRNGDGIKTYTAEEYKAAFEAMP